MTDFVLYHINHSLMRQLIREGEYGSPEFQKLWGECEEIKNRNNGLPPLPPDFDDRLAQELEECEAANMQGTR